MAGQRQPTNVLLATGKKHFTKAEIEERLDSEIAPLTDNITAPDYLTKKQKTEFNKISAQLQELNIMSETDVDALARFIIANENFIHATKQLRKSEVKNNPLVFETWSKIQERYFKLCRASANDLGLTISSRCKLVVPKPQGGDKPKPNKFNAFTKGEPVQ